MGIDVNELDDKQIRTEIKRAELRKKLADAYRAEALLAKTRGTLIEKTVIEQLTNLLSIWCKRVYGSTVDENVKQAIRELERQWLSIIESSLNDQGD